jgi:hypothetical protein
MVCPPTTGVTYLWLLQQGVDSIVVPAGLGSAATPDASSSASSSKSATTTVDFVEVDEYGDIVIQPQQKNTPRQQQQPQSKSSSGSKPMRGSSTKPSGGTGSFSSTGRGGSTGKSSGSTGGATGWDRQYRDFSTRGGSTHGQGQAVPQQQQGASNWGMFRRLDQTAPPQASPHAAAASAAGAAGAAQGSAARKLLSNPAVRLAFLGALTLSAVTLVGGSTGEV